MDNSEENHDEFVSKKMESESKAQLQEEMKEESKAESEEGSQLGDQPKSSSLKTQTTDTLDSMRQALPDGDHNYHPGGPDTMSHEPSTIRPINESS